MVHDKFSNHMGGEVHMGGEAFLDVGEMAQMIQYFQFSSDFLPFSILNLK